MNRLFSKVRPKNAHVNLVLGPSGAGKSWVCANLADTCCYVSYDEKRETALQRLMDATLQDKPILFDPLVGVPAFMAENPQFTYSYYVISEPDTVIAARLVARGGAVSASFSTQVHSYDKYKELPLCHTGTSAEILALLKLHTAPGAHFVYTLGDGQGLKQVPVYVGKGSSKPGYNRLDIHRQELHQVVHQRSQKLHKALYRYLAQRVYTGGHTVIYINGVYPTADEAFVQEVAVGFQYLTKFGRVLFNQYVGNNGPRGNVMVKVPRREVSDETRAKLSAAREGFKFERPYSSKGCWRLTDDEISALTEFKGGPLAVEDGLAKLNEAEIAFIRNRRNLVKYHANPLRKEKVLAWHADKQRVKREAAAKRLGKPESELMQRLNHLAHLTAEQRKSRTNELWHANKLRRDGSITLEDLNRLLAQIEARYQVQPIKRDGHYVYSA